MNAPVLIPLRVKREHAKIPQKPRKKGLAAATKLILLLVAAISVAGIWIWRDFAARDPLADILIAQVVKGDIERAVLATGTLRPVKLVAVGAQASGRLTSMAVAVGQTVRKGDLIAKIDDLNQQNSLKTAQAMLESVRAQLREKQATLIRAQASLAREELTLAQKATSRDSFENAQMNAKMAQSQIDFLQAQIVISEVAVDNAKVNLAYTNIVAPIDGTVLLIITQEGQTVNAMQSAPTIVVLGQVDKMAVRAEISEADITRVKPGLPVYFTVLGDTVDRWEGKLASIDPAPDSIRSDASIQSATSASPNSSSSQTTTSAIYYYGNFDVANLNGKLLTYMTAQVRIVLDQVKDVLTIPVSAVSTGPNGEQMVEVVDGQNRLSRRVVETGLDDKVRIEIRSGLSAGERIVANRKSAQAAKSVMQMRPPPPPGF